LYGPKDDAESFIEGLDVLSNMRLCPNVPAQHVVATALGGHPSVDQLLLHGGRLREQRGVAYEGLTSIPGISVQKAQGALYMFPGSIGRCTGSTPTSSSPTTCCAHGSSWSPRARASTSARTTTSGWSPCRRSRCSPTRSTASATTSAPSAAEPNRLGGPAAGDAGPASGAARAAAPARVLRPLP